MNTPNIGLLLLHFTVSAALFSVGAPIPLQAQEDLTVRLIPRFGLLAPDAYFYEEFANFADDEPTEWTNGSLGRAAVAGLGVEVGSEGRGIYVRGEVARSFSGWLSAVHGIVIPRTLFEPPRIVNTWLDVPAALTFANLNAMLPTRFKVWGVQPFVLVGAGGKWYSFDPPTEENTVGAILPSNGFTAAVELGGGGTFSLYGIMFTVEIRDSINRYWDKTQHDLIFSGGLVWRLR